MSELRGSEWGSYTADKPTQALATRWQGGLATPASHGVASGSRIFLI